jgi:hypothetical protein
MTNLIVTHEKVLKIMKLLFLVTSLTVMGETFGFCGSGKGKWFSDERGEYIIVPMKNAPFPHKSREKGYTFENTFYTSATHYSDSSVGILIPANYEKKDTVDLIIHFHGHMNNVKNEIEQFHLRKQLHEAGRNVIMILPQGPKDVQDSTCGKMEEPDGLKHLVIEAVDFLYGEGKIKSRKLGRIVLSGHSGGYRPIAFCLDVGGLEDYIKEVYLLDAAYANLSSYSSWAARSGGRLISIFTDHLMGENVEIMSDLQKLGIDKFNILLDDDVTTETLRKNHITFIHTKLSHDELVYQTQYLRSFIAAGGFDIIR